MTEDRPAVRLHRIRQQAEHAIRRLIRDMTRGEAKG